MERNKAPIATQRSSHREEGERRQTPEEYIAHRREVAVDRVMAAFHRWLDKRLAIISYTIEASEASDDTGTTGSQSRDTGGEKRSGGASGRPKRQFPDDEPNDVEGGGDENGQDRGGNKRAKKGK
jgi:hypothetical protein